jgi:hypothetical protein
LPLLHTKSPELEEIIKVCKFGPEPEKLVKQKPLRIHESATFVINQGGIGLKHPFDLDADDISGAFTKKDNVRFYEVEGNEDKLIISSEVHVTRDRNGRIIAGTYNKRTREGWKPKTANMSKLHAVFRRRAVHKETLEKEGSSFNRVIMFVMSVAEYNNVKGKIKDMKIYNLLYPYIIMHYYFTGGRVVPIHGQPHGNAKSANATEFRPREHSTKVELRENAASDMRAPRIVALESTEEIQLLEIDSDCTIVRDLKQITNYKYVYFVFVLTF